MKTYTHIIINDLVYGPIAVHSKFNRIIFDPLDSRSGISSRRVSITQNHFTEITDKNEFKKLLGTYRTHKKPIIDHQDLFYFVLKTQHSIDNERPQTIDQSLQLPPIRSLKQNVRPIWPDV